MRYCAVRNQKIIMLDPKFIIIIIIIVVVVLKLTSYTDCDTGISVSSIMACVCRYGAVVFTWWM